MGPILLTIKTKYSRNCSLCELHNHHQSKQQLRLKTWKFWLALFLRSLIANYFQLWEVSMLLRSSSCDCLDIGLTNALITTDTTVLLSYCSSVLSLLLWKKMFGRWMSYYIMVIRWRWCSCLFSTAHLLEIQRSSTLLILR